MAAQIVPINNQDPTYNDNNVSNMQNPLNVHTKVYFGFYNSETKKYNVQNRPFVTGVSTQDGKYITGQFLSSLWFNYSFSVHDNVTFLVITTKKGNTDCDSNQVENWLNTKQCYKLGHIAKFELNSAIMEGYYFKSKSNNGKSMKINLFGCDVKNTFLELDIRPVTMDSHNNNDKRVQLSLPQFTCLL